jgi:hypothetical protein
MHKGSLGFGSGLNLLGSEYKNYVLNIKPYNNFINRKIALNFCFNSSFIKSFEEILDEFQSNNLARESICKLLGRLYNTARDSDDYD